MSDPSETPRAGNPNAPQIQSWVYIVEREVLAGSLIGAISYGIVVALFFRCMSALLNPVNDIRGGIKWGLVAHTVAMFSFLTLPIAVDLNDRSNCYINERNYPGDDEIPPGPFGAMSLINIEGLHLAYAAMFPLNQWLADGLLLHRCHVIYFMNYWVMVFPCLIYLTSIVTGIAYIYEQSTDGFYLESLGISFFSMAFSLTILLTLMIVTRLILHSRDIRKAMGGSNQTNGRGLYTAIVTMLIESYALYALTFVTYAVPWAIDSYVASTVSKLLGSVQVIAPYLIILRVANRRALTNDVISGTGSVGSLCFDFKSQGTEDGDRTFPDGDPVSIMEANGEAVCELGAGSDGAVEEVLS